jgi:hypothetical protein
VTARTGIACTLAFAALAMPATAQADLADGGFEHVPSAWTTPDVTGADVPLEACAHTAVCLTGADQFGAPLSGRQMARLGGPFQDEQEQQTPGEENVLRQSFRVPSGGFGIAYDLLTYDYRGLDKLTITVRDGSKVLAQKVVPAVGYDGSTLPPVPPPSPDTSRKATGWQLGTFDFSGTSEVGRLATFEVSLRAGDGQLGTWVDVDGGTVPIPVSVSAPGDPNFGVDVNAADGQTFFLIDGLAPGQQGCTRPGFTMRIPGAQGSPHLVFVGDQGMSKAFDTQPTGGPAEFKPDEAFFCLEGSGDLFVTYDDGSDHVVPVARVSKVDRAGRIYDRVKFDQLMNLPDADAAGARKGAAIGGATLRLQRLVDGGWEPVVSEAPGLNPPLNPETTNGDGHYQWSVPAGHYRVAATAPGYADATTPEFDGPTTLRDMDVPMEALNQPPPPEQGPPLIFIDPELLRLPPVPQAPPPTDRGFAGVGFATRIRVDRKGVATFKLRCPAGERACKGEIHGKTAVTVPRDASRRARQKTSRQLAVRAIRFRIDGPGQAKLRAKLSRKVVARLKRDSRLAVDLSIDAQDGAGNQTTTKAEVTFIYGKRKPTPR